MDWSTLISVVIGGLIAIIPILINNRFQSRENERIREEALREAKTQLALELMRNDVKIVDDSINDSLNALSLSRNLAFKRDRGKISHDEMLEELESFLMGDNDKLEINFMVDKVAFTFGDEFYSHFQDWDSLLSDYSDLMLSPASQEEKDEELDRLWSEIISAAGKLHIMLRERIISIRDV